MQAILRNRTLLWVFFGLALFNVFLNNHNTSLWDEDEAAYAGFAHVMRTTGNWVVPDFLWSEPHRKTPLHFWAIAGSYWLFGENEFAVRFPSALSVVLTCLTLYWLGREVFGREVTLGAALLMACSILLPNLGKISVTDALLTFFETVAALAIIRHYERPSWRWAGLLWAAVALGVLVKGPPILILTFGMMGLLVLFHPKRWRFVSLHPWLGLPLALLPLWLWGRAAWLSDGGVYIRWMIDWYILKRASGGVAFGQWGPPGYFLLVFFISFLPWAVFFPKAIGRFFRRAVRWQPEPTYLYLGVWFVAGWFLYELIPSKLPSYAMGAYAGFALLLSQTILDTESEGFVQTTDLRVGQWLLLIFTLLIGVGLIVGASLLLDAWGIGMAVITAVFWTGLGLVAWQAYRRGALERGIKASALQVLLFVFFAWLLIVPSFEQPRGATKRIAQSIASESTKDTEVVMARPFYPSLPFYLTQVPRHYRGLAHADFAQVFDLYARPQKTVLIFDAPKYQEFLDGLAERQQVPPQHTRIISGWMADMGKLIDYTLVYNYPPAN
ncbi:ArnT family glycosyltransferase [Eisenibacter elegans]|jgi:4-amino-4-deoxy-L-arabinose transferase-like glycosyltransferase|uniref:ArnT family glycosyltransferase n=1 Tax=Eisenibacter elegans TaxID=997 RepID=UPI00047A0533|nr:glycosyltransferase family 39 protein [Eisenibacter elegans]